MTGDGTGKTTTLWRYACSFNHNMLTACVIGILAVLGNV